MNMTTKSTFLGLLVILFSIFAWHSYTSNHQQIVKNQIPSQWFYQQRAYPFDKVNREAYQLAKKQALLLQKNPAKGLEWSLSGPTNIGGRLTDVEINPQNTSVIYLGAASGGVFKSTNNGTSYSAVFDEAESLSIGDIALAPANPDIVYVGTGEANPGGGSMAYDGNGIYKSMDAGSSWAHLGLEDIGSVGRVVVSPENPDIAYVAAMGYLFENNEERGVYKTVDGGENWDKVLYLNDSTGAVDLAIHPQNPDTIYAAMWQRVRRLEYYVYGGNSCGIYRSYDGGDNWVELDNGLPTNDDVGRIGIGISQSDPNVLYAIYADKVGYFKGIYKSEDGGNSWSQTNDGNLSDMYASYGWWFGRLKIDPNNADVVYAIGFDLYKTTNGGGSWSYASGAAHVDQHEVAISPDNSNHVLLANDGGLYHSENAGSSWNHQLNLPITQFYTCAIDASQPQRLYGGAQDNGTNRTMTGNANDWASIYGGDGFYCMVDPSDNTYVYAEYQYGNFARSTNSGSYFSSATSGINYNDRKNWNTPVVMNPTDPTVLYYGANRLYKSTNRAASWTAISGDLTNGASSGNQNFGTITTISVSAANTNIIYAGTDDGNVWISEDDGGSWTKISEDLPTRWISRVVADPVDSQVAYVCLSGFRQNEYMPHIYKTTDNGSSWEDVSQGLPEAPVNDLIIDPDNTHKLIAATDVGVFYKDENTDNWLALSNGLPRVPITDLSFHSSSNKLVAATYGRSMYVLDFSVGLEEEAIIADISFNVYPNPASEVVEISMESYKAPYIVELVSINGQIIYSESHDQEKTKIALSNLGIKSGVYLLSIKMNGLNKTVKLVVE